MKRLVGKLQTMADLVNFFYSSSSSKRTITWAKLHGSWVVIHVLKCMAHAHQTWCIMMTHVKKESYVQSMGGWSVSTLQVTKGCSWTSHGWAVSGRLTMSRLGQKCPMRSTNGFDCTVSSLSAASKGPFKGKIPTTRIAPPVNKTWCQGPGMFFLESMNELLPEFIHNHCVMTCIKGISKYPCIVQSFRHLSTQKATFWLEQPRLLLKNWTSLEKHHSNLK